MQNQFYKEFDYETLPGNRPCNDHRTPFQIDRDRIIFSYAFRRLQSKTQVFKSGEYDFYRTRLTHSIEVARIGRSICDYLKASSPLLKEDFFIDPDLVEAVGLAHDLGHPPFGHIGERKLNELMIEDGGFEGNAQTLRILSDLIYEREDGPRGMSPTRAFLDGIIKYKMLFSERVQSSESGNNTYPDNHFLYDEQANYRKFALGGQEIPKELFDTGALNHHKSIECQIMDWADDTAYSLHDIIDGIRAKFLNQEKIERWASDQTLSEQDETHLTALINTIRKGNVEARFSNKVGAFIQAANLVPLPGDFMGPLTSRYQYKLEIDETIHNECLIYKKLAFDLIFQAPQIQQIEFKGGHVLEVLFNAFSQHHLSSGTRNLKILPPAVSKWITQEPTLREKKRRLCDHIAGLTDILAIRTYKRLFDPDFGSIFDIS